ncbi:hypothetical protein AB870_01010 [Pandoraea faecigallinarum]|uniref:Glycerophosphoryl diester phosphodiesterase membrane domain-containing protein n=1 Tax=Pandoraea faecigallinarum TaxID=656179 RepID=A0A0H3WR25_9BURK|nr:hypothetical protein [Pandoraea faecigallinarum]AKM29013.1 hypothetical protein AB870_01010 [Pandoraea faecigallinarum]
MEPITFKQCFKGAWIDGFSALRNRPLLTISIAVVILVTLALGTSVKQLAATAAQTGMSAAYRLELALASMGIGLVNVVAFSILAVHTLRHVILGPDIARATPWYRDVGRYVWASIQIGVGFGVVTAAIMVIAVLALRVSGHGNSSALVLTLLVLLICLVVFVAIRLSLILAQIGAGRSKRWRAAWQDTRGHFWSIFGTGVAIALPVIVGALIVLVVVELLVRMTTSTTVLVLAALILQAVISVVWMAVICAGNGWIYHRYANRLLDLEGAPDDV